MPELEDVLRSSEYCLRVRIGETLSKELSDLVAARVDDIIKAEFSRVSSGKADESVELFGVDQVGTGEVFISSSELGEDIVVVAFACESA